MDQTHRLETVCPVGISACPVAEEIVQLREECGRLSELLQIDPLTGLFNFQHLMQMLNLEMERTRRTGFPTGLIMIDLDHFKRVNDSYGHQAGNAVLKTVSRLWRESIRQMDIPCRYGGEEFAIVLPGTSLQQGVRTAERLRSIAEGCTAEFEGLRIRVTASFGVHAYRAVDRDSADELLARADQYLLEAKAKGRNRVCYAESEPQVRPTELTMNERTALFVTRWPATG